MVVTSTVSIVEHPYHRTLTGDIARGRYKGRGDGIATEVIDCRGGRLYLRIHKTVYRAAPIGWYSEVRDIDRIGIYPIMTVALTVRIRVGIGLRFILTIHISPSHHRSGGGDSVPTVICDGNSSRVYRSNVYKQLCCRHWLAS